MPKLSRRRKKNGAPAMSMSLLDMLFSTFGGIIILSILFSALISEQPALPSNRFYHATIEITANVQNWDKQKRALSEVTVYFYHTDDRAKVNGAAAKVFKDHGLDDGDGELTSNDSALSVFVSRQHKEPISVEYQWQVVDLIDITYLNELADIEPNLAYRVNYTASCDLCDSQTLNIQVEEQIGNKRVRWAPIKINTRDAEDLNLFNKNLASPIDCQMDSCDIPIKGELKQ